MTFRQLMLNSGVKVLHDNYPQWRGCQRKRRYSTLAKAQVVAQETGHGHAYYCEDCFGFHIGHSVEEREKTNNGK